MYASTPKGEIKRGPSVSQGPQLPFLDEARRLTYRLRSPVRLTFVSIFVLPVHLGRPVFQGETLRGDDPGAVRTA
jgi:hypothetical protein